MAVLIISVLPWDNKDYLDLLLCHTMFLSRWSLSSCCQQFKINNSVHFTATFAQKLRLKVLSWPWKQLLTKLSHHKIHLVAVLELEDRTKGRLEFFFLFFCLPGWECLCCQPIVAPSWVSGQTSHLGEKTWRTVGDWVQLKSHNEWIHLWIPTMHQINSSVLWQLLHGPSAEIFTNGFQGQLKISTFREFWNKLSRILFE